MIRVIVASQNPIKVNCTKSGFSLVFPNSQINVQGKSFPSGVSDQPMTDEETLRGAKNRAEAAKASIPDADYWVGIEGGLEEEHGEMQVFAWIYILSPESMGKSRTATFQLPNAITELIRQGMELGDADDLVFQRSNSKQGSGAVGILTHDLIDRSSYYEPAVVLALIPFSNPELY